MHGSCSRFLSIVDYLKKNSLADADELEVEVRKHFPDAKIEHKNLIALSVEFKTSLPCYDEAVQNLGVRSNFQMGPSPPPLDANQAPIKFSSIEEDPYRWNIETYQIARRTFSIGTDGARIKSLRIDYAAPKRNF